MVVINSLPSFRPTSFTSECKILSKLFKVDLLCIPQIECACAKPDLVTFCTKEALVLSTTPLEWKIAQSKS